MANIKIAKKQFVIDELAKKVDLPTEPVAGQGVNVPYYFSVDYSADKATVKDYTVDLLDKSKAPQTFSLDINAATDSTAGLMTSADKTKLDSLTPGTGGDMVTITANDTFSGKAKVSGTFSPEELVLVKKDTTTIKVIDNNADLGVYVIAVNKLVGNVDESGTKAYLYEGVYMAENGQFVQIAVEIDHEGNWTVRQHNIIGAYQYLDDEHETALYDGGIALDATYGWYNLTGTLEDNFKAGETLRGVFSYDGVGGVTFDDQAYTGDITVGTRSFSKVDILNMTDGFYLAYLPDDAGDVQLRLVNNGTHTIDEALATLNSVKLTEEYTISPMDAQCIAVDGTTIRNEGGVLEAIKQETEAFSNITVDGDATLTTATITEGTVTTAPTDNTDIANKEYVDTTAASAASNKLNKLGKEAVSQEPYHFGYYYSIVPSASNIVVNEKTITLDGNESIVDYNLTVPAATTSLAGLMTSTDKTKLDELEGLPTKVANRYLHTNASNVAEWAELSIATGVTYKGIVADISTVTGMVAGDMWFVGTAEPYAINIYNGTSWDSAGTFSIDLSTYAPKASPALTGTATCVNLTASGEIALDSTGSADFTKGTIVKVPTITAASDNSCAVNKEYLESYIATLDGNDTSY